MRAGEDRDMIWGNVVGSHCGVCLLPQCIFHKLMLQSGRGESVVFNFEFWMKHTLLVEVTGSRT